VGHKRQLLAAHVDRVVLVLAHGKALREGFLMRGLVACSLQHLPPLVVVNKLDLDEDGETAEHLAAWRKLGIRCLGTSTVSGEGIAELTEILGKGSSAMLGHSGVGKSTLINTIRPGTTRKTGGLDWQGKGRHVTTMAEAIVQQGSMLLDLPGIRELGLWGASTEEVLNAFPDVKEAMAGCHFANCAHDEDAVGCAVWEAVEQDKLDGARVLLCLRMQMSVAMGTEGGGRL
jgi:ribosome biogenesis GTPase